MALANELANTSRSQVCRMAAALQLKNQLTSKDVVVKLDYQRRWLSLDENVRFSVKAQASGLFEGILYFKFYTIRQICCMYKL